MNLFGHNIESVNASKEVLERSALTPSEIAYMKELELKPEIFEKLELNDKIDYIRNIDNRVSEISERTGLSKDVLYKEFYPEIETIKTRQHTWDGKSVNGVQYSMQPFVSSTGKVYRGVFPEFPAKREIILPEYCMSDAFWKEYGKSSDRMQMKYATQILKEELIRDPDLKELMGLTEQQYMDIMNEKDKITGLTWHHDIDYGRMKLIDESVHSFKEHPHSGGMATWNDRWIQEHLLPNSDQNKLEEAIVFDEILRGKMSDVQLNYIQETLPLNNPDLLVVRIDEINDCRPPKAVDSDPQVAEMITPVKETISPLCLEAPQDYIQIEQISDTMTRIEGLEFSEWKELPFGKRIDLLQNIENEVALIAHRPSCPIQTGSLGKGYFGSYSPESKTITINSDYIQSNDISDYKEVLDTIIHEGRHAYQYYNLTEREVHPRQGDISNWKANEFEYGYQDARTQGFAAYYLQPQEADARAFAEDVLKQYQEKIA